MTEPRDVNEDEDGIDGPFERAMDRAIREDAAEKKRRQRARQRRRRERREPRDVNVYGLGDRRGPALEVARLTHYWPGTVEARLERDIWIAYIDGAQIGTSPTKDGARQLLVDRGAL